MKRRHFLLVLCRSISDERNNMFGKIIYYDKKTIAEYKSIINGKPNLEIEEYDVSNDRGMNADLKLMSADVKASKSYKARVQESDLYDCD